MPVVGHQGNNDTHGTQGTYLTGSGGGGGGENEPGGMGGHGIIIIAYPTDKDAATISSGLTYSVSTSSRSGYRVYSFTAGTGTISF